MCLKMYIPNNIEWYLVHQSMIHFIGILFSMPLLLKSLTPFAQQDHADCSAPYPETLPLTTLSNVSPAPLDDFLPLLLLTNMRHFPLSPLNNSCTDFPSKTCLNSTMPISVQSLRDSLHREALYLQSEDHTQHLLMINSI